MLDRIGQRISEWNKKNSKRYFFFFWLPLTLIKRTGRNNLNNLKSAGLRRQIFSLFTWFLVKNVASVANGTIKIFIRVGCQLYDFPTRPKSLRVTLFETCYIISHSILPWKMFFSSSMAAASFLSFHTFLERNNRE